MLFDAHAVETTALSVIAASMNVDGRISRRIGVLLQSLMPICGQPAKLDALNGRRDGHHASSLDFHVEAGANPSHLQAVAAERRSAKRRRSGNREVPAAAKNDAQAPRIGNEDFVCGMPRAHDELGEGLKLIDPQAVASCARGDEAIERRAVSWCAL